MYRVFHKDQRIDYQTLRGTVAGAPHAGHESTSAPADGALTTIQLSENAAAITWVIDECQQMQGFWNAAKFAQGSRQQGSLAFSLQGWISSDALSFPIFREPATRKKSSQFWVISFGLRR